MRLKHFGDPASHEEAEYNVRVALQHLLGRKALLFPIEPQAVLDGDPPYMLSLIWSLIFFYKLSGRWASWEALKE